MSTPAAAMFQAMQHQTLTCPAEAEADMAPLSLEDHSHRVSIGSAKGCAPVSRPLAVQYDTSHSFGIHHQIERSKLGGMLSRGCFAGQSSAKLLS